jgi:putative DNA primase/helicase
MAVKFEDVAAAALDMAPELLYEWIGGQRRGHEWVGERKANGGLGDSWCVNLNTGQYAHFAGTEKGPDLVALYADLNHIDRLPALKVVAERVGVADRPTAPILPRVQSADKPPEPIPEGTADPKPHYKHGAASVVYRYGSEFAVARYDLPDGKVFAQYTWRGGKWVSQAHPGPRQLYGVGQLARHKDAPVLIVEGEKCAEAAAAILRKYVAVTWAGGSNAVKKSDWTSLEGRDVIIWPDADEAGSQAAAQIAQILVPLATRVRVIQPDRSDGWDIANAVAEGMDAKAIANWAGARIKTTIEAEPETDKPPPIETEYLPVAERKRDIDYPGDQPPRAAMVVWKEIGLFADAKDVPYPTLANASMIMRFHPLFKGRIWWDSFAERIYHTLRGSAPQEWTDIDSKRTAAYIQQTLQLPRISLKLVEDAVDHAAFEDQRNSVQEWLNSLEWDGTERLSLWVGDCLGVDLTAYSMAVSRNWIISMVARAYRPGCQVDTMPVLEGVQGEGKSSALEILGDQWYSSVGTAFGSYDFINTIQGRWLVEIPDMAGFGRREHSHVIATITTRTDRYRVKYGHRDQDHPRKCVFAATSETDDYLSEMRGYRRYWPLRCKAIDLVALRAQREQLFAEAVVAYRAGQSYHTMPAEETAAEQRARNSEDPWTADVLAYCESRGLAGQPVHPSKILTDSEIHLPTRDLDLSKKLRVITILKAHGWVQKPIGNQRMYVKPIRVTREDKA